MTTDINTKTTQDGQRHVWQARDRLMRRWQDWLDLIDADFERHQRDPDEPDADWWTWKFTELREEIESLRGYIDGLEEDLALRQRARNEIDQIAKLRAKADSTTFPEEAASFCAKADERERRQS